MRSSVVSPTRPAGPSHVSAAGSLRVTTPVPRDVWEEVVAADPQALVCQTPQWIDALTACGHSDASRLYETPSGGRLVLPLVRRGRLRPAGLSPLASMPDAWGMGGLIADVRLEAADLAAVVADLRSLPAPSVRVRPNPFHARVWEEATGGGSIALPRRAHVVDLRGGADEVWRTMTKTGRNRIRKGERSGLDVECDTTGRLVPVFHQLLQVSVERWARHQHEPLALARFRANRRDPLAKLERMAAALGDAMRVWVASKDGEPVAATIVLVGANASATRGAMNKALAAPTCANQLLEWLAIQDACAAGCDAYHLGESGPSRSLARYKEQFGARPVDYAEHRFERLPLTRADTLARSAVKRALRFRDA